MQQSNRGVLTGRPHRPLGVSLAIVLTVLLFTVIPLMQVVQLLLIRQRVSTALTENGIQPIGSGGEILGVSESTLMLRGLFAALFLVIAVFAWRGRPAASRWLLILAVFAITGLRFVEIVSQLSQQADFESGFTSADSLLRTLNTGQFFASLIVLLYVVWYMNRAPARAFYRGYYLTEDS